MARVIKHNVLDVVSLIAILGYVQQSKIRAKGLFPEEIHQLPLRKNIRRKR